MKKLCFVLYAVLFTLTVHSLSQATTMNFDPSLYTFLTVFEPSPHKYAHPTINNNGEIVAVGSNTLFSSTRGEIPLHPSTTAGVYDPVINDSGEVAYRSGKPYSTGGPFYIYTNIRGPIAEGSQPVMNNLGEIVYETYGTLPMTSRLISSTRGTIGEYNSFNFAPGDINDSGEIVYQMHTGTNMAIFSTTRGQLSTTFAYHPRINNYGDVLYHDGNTIAYDGAELTPWPVWQYWDMNDYGDLVFNVESLYGIKMALNLDPNTPWYTVKEIYDEIKGCKDCGFSHSDTLYTILATQDPSRYPQYSEYYGGGTVPEPTTMLLLGAGLVGLAGFGRKKFKK